jgi:hypothetical protein
MEKQHGKQRRRGLNVRGRCGLVWYAPQSLYCSCLVRVWWEGEGGAVTPDRDF